MANNLRITVVAEGVETEDQKSFLHSQQCDKIQGFLYSPPVPEENFTEMLEKEKVLLLS
jgi:EAL domain-containing protein (putative c-di-GMP-specific phosphodiesterase class I)